jgi:hypothetical protein
VSSFRSSTVPEGLIESHPAVDRVRAALAAAGHPHAVFRLSPDALVRLTGGTVVEVT